MAFMVSHNFLEPGLQLSRCSSYFFLRCSFVELLISVFSSFILRCGTGPLHKKNRSERKIFGRFIKNPISDMSDKFIIFFLPQWSCKVCANVKKQHFFEVTNIEQGHKYLLNPYIFLMSEISWISRLQNSFQNWQVPLGSGSFITICVPIHNSHPPNHS